MRCEGVMQYVEPMRYAVELNNNNAVRCGTDVVRCEIDAASDLQAVASLATLDTGCKL